MKNKITNYILIIIALVGIFLRVYAFWKIPPAFNWDEAAIGWNAKTIWDMHVDEFGHHLPLSFQSFGDFKSPFLIYLLSPLVGIIGNKIWVVRLPSVVAGILAIGGFYYLAVLLSKRLFDKKDLQAKFTLISFAIFAISPWHLLYSRAAFEANLALTQIIFGLALFFQGLEFVKLKKFSILKHPWLWWLGSGVFFIASFYTYHSPKVVVPLLGLALLALYFKQIYLMVKKNWLIASLVIIFLTLIALPIAKENLFGHGAGRGGVTIFYDDTGKLRDFNSELIKDIGDNLWQHLQPGFYILGSDVNLRNKLLHFGLMPIVQLPLFYLGIIIVLWHIFRKKLKKIYIFLLLSFLIGLLPGVLGRGLEVPHPLRSLNALPIIILLSSLGAVWLLQKITKNSYRKILIYSLIFLFLLDSIRFLREYFKDYPVYAAQDWQYGYQQAVKVAKKYQDQAKEVRITTAYGQPQVFTYFFQNKTAQDVLWGGMRKYTFRELSWEADKQSKDVLLVGTGEEIPEKIDHARLLKQINFPDGKVAFRIVLTDK